MPTSFLTRDTRKICARSTSSARRSEFLERTHSKPFAHMGQFHGAAFALRFSDRGSRGRFDPGGFPPPGWAGGCLADSADLSRPDRAGQAGHRGFYYTSVEYLDRNVGRVLRSVTAAGLEGDTSWSTWPTTAMTWPARADRKALRLRSCVAGAADHALPGRDPERRGHAI